MGSTSVIRKAALVSSVSSVDPLTLTALQCVLTCSLAVYAAASSPVLSSLAKEGPIASIAAVVFFGARVDYGHGPALAHVAGSGAGQMESRTTDGKHYLYPSARPFFGVPAHTDYHAASASLAHTRTLSFLKPLLGGPYFDIEAVWEEHTQFEFGERSVEKTMATMVEQPYVSRHRVHHV